MVNDNCQVFRLTGLLDAFSEATFIKTLKAKIDKESKLPKNIILDLSKIDFLDSSGLGALVQLVKHVKQNQGTLQIVSNARVTQTVKLVRLEQFLSLRSSLDDAIKHLNKS
ncbi:MAG: STAS domain-containing protein [Trichodesmium sp. St15_bin1_1]|nr:STAS domain-containing protein [Trichodesmium sp. St15_bin1_1]